jgi:hypothetical protein
LLEAPLYRWLIPPIQQFHDADAKQENLAGSVRSDSADALNRSAGFSDLRALDSVIAPRYSREAILRD